ncbi:MAG: hypothetical protein AAGI28_09135 [Pseudomonadota bacterium]
MKVELKTWGQLGVATALAGLTLTGCAEEAAEDGGDAAQVAEAGEGGEGEGGEGEGGEGEGGVDTASAASDPIVFGSALAIAEAHVIAARDAYAAGETEAGAEMFAHPVSEVLLELQPVFSELGVDDLSPLFTGASEAALQGASADDIAGKADGIVTALRAAEDKAPSSDASAGKIAAGVVADQIERAVEMYGQAADTTIYGPYLDGYGFYKAAQTTYERSADAIKGEDAELASTIEKTLGLLGEAFPGVERPQNLDANQAALSGASAGVLLAAS